MNVRELKERLQIESHSFFSDSKLQEIIDKESSNVDYHYTTFKDCVILYEVSRLMGDKTNTEYYKNILLGKLGMVY
jgi:hypothetical protein